MATIFRYTEPTTSRGGLASAQAVRKIRLAIRRGQLDFFEKVIKEGDRLDMIAASQYGDGRLWWIIAAASNIGWWMQVPVGTKIRIPINLAQIDQAAL